MSRSNYGAPKLPQSLLDQIQPSSDRPSLRNGGRKQNQFSGRKEQRKAARVEKKQQKQVRRPIEPTKYEPKAERIVVSQSQKQVPDPVLVKPERTPKVKIRERKEKDPGYRPIDGSSNTPTNAPISRAVRVKLQDDDDEIAALEKKLGLKGKKKNTKSAEQDGLDDLLSGLADSADEGSDKRKRSDYDEYLATKRRHVEIAGEFSSSNDSDGDDSELDSNSLDDLDGSEHNAEDEESGDKDDGRDEFGGFSDDSSVWNEEVDDKEKENEEDKGNYDDDVRDEDQNQPRKRENPYVPPMPTSASAAGKYIPPSMRNTSNSDTEILTRIRRQLQGLVNKLSEANLLTIVRDVEAIYNNHPRQHVTEVLIDLVMGLVCDRTALIDTFILLHAGFAVAIHRKFGHHFGAQVLERCVADFERFYELEKASVSGSKETTNLVAFLSELYTLGLVGGNLIFDYIRFFLSSLTDLHTELLLRIIKTCGSQLRHDDPTSLKDIVLLLQKSVATVGESNLPVRTKFMIEMINDLKNNKLKTSLANSSMVAEHIVKMKKMLGTLKPCEPLGIGLADIKSAEKVGKWYLVGASWRNGARDDATFSSGHNLHQAAAEEDDTKNGDSALADEDHLSADLNTLAKSQRMNTSIRRAIFINIMSASDYQDAYTRVTKLRLKKAQELEIPRVLIHCAASEQDGYNPYYTLIAKNLCAEHKYQWAMQYGLWAIFRRLGEKNGNDTEMNDDATDEDDESLGPREIVNLGRMYGSLIADDQLSLMSFKVLDFAYLQAKTKMFLEIILATAFKHFAKKHKSESGEVDSAIAKMLTRARDTPQVISGLNFFVTRQVSNPEDIASTSSERRILKRGFKTARTVLSQLSNSLSGSSF